MKDAPYTTVLFQRISGYQGLALIEHTNQSTTKKRRKYNTRK